MAAVWSIRKKSANNGKTSIDILLPISPNTGGMNIEPTYAEAISSPMISDDLSTPKYSGVWCIIDGYIGPNPNPSRKSAATESFPGMNAIRRIAMSDAVSPIASIFLSPSLSLMKPENSLPAVIPQKSTPADTAARPSEKPLASTRNVADHIMAVFSIEQYAKKADLLLYMAYSSIPLDESDAHILQLIQGKKCIALLNKSDLAPVLTEEELREKLPEGVPVVRISAKENQGLDEFEKVLTDLFFSGKISFNEEVVITSMRHKEALESARDSLLEVKKSLEAGMPEDFFSIDLMSAYSSLGEIIGEEVGEDLVNEIFSKFCMGK